jgi:fructose/tagatose bisphosphate aldolase
MKTVYYIEQFFKGCYRVVERTVQEESITTQNNDIFTTLTDMVDGDEYKYQQNVFLSKWDAWMDLKRRMEEEIEYEMGILKAVNLAAMKDESSVNVSRY